MQHSAPSAHRFNPTFESNVRRRVSPRDPEEVVKATKVVPPVWPLQNTVAVNPFWYFRDRSFEMMVNEKSRVQGIEVIMPLEYYEERVSRGELRSEDIQEALSLLRLEDPVRFGSKGAFDMNLRAVRTDQSQVHTISEFLFGASNVDSFVIAECAKHASAYLDERQAVSAYPWAQLSFWQAWQKAQALDPSMDLIGFRGFGRVAGQLAELDSGAAIQEMLEKMEIQEGLARRAYLERLALSVIGWASQFRYLEWQRSLGYTVQSQGTLQDLIAVRLCYDYGAFVLTKSEIAHLAWKAQLIQVTEASDLLDGDIRSRLVYQLATEISYQREVVRKLQSPACAQAVTPLAQVVFCIDVRSEMIRRHIESIAKDIQTIGFAGFFGLALDYRKPGEDRLGHRLPVLLKSSHIVENLGRREDLISDEVMAYLRRLRKNSFSSFLFVELFGAMYGLKLIRKGFSRLISRFQGGRSRWKDDSPVWSQVALKTSAGDMLGAREKAEKAATILRHMGLTTGFAQLVLILGHGSRTENNAFGSSLDCGACGGHPGDTNAKTLASLLNDHEVRTQLERLGISIPEKTQFISGVHETVTDAIEVFAGDLLAENLLALERLRKVLQEASTQTRQERQTSRTDAPSDPAEVRSRNWSEVRPEWGLAGNACFIVAPRSRTRGLSFASRSFLHDYDWKQDQAEGYKTLELILTAPMVVTNWINLQYYASTVAPAIYGAGNKVLHNLVNEVGVIEGNCGDLRIGLPIQSVNDGKKMVHEPLRLSVFIEAPRSEIERIIQKHETVRQLVSHGWLHILQIDSSGSQVLRRSRGGEYVPVKLSAF